MASYKLNGAYKKLGVVQMTSSALGETFDFQVPQPIGKDWIDLSIELLELVSKFSELEKDATSIGGQIKMFRTLFSEDESRFWDTLLPAVMGVEDDAEKAGLLKQAFTLIEIMTPFFEAAAMIVGAALGGEEVEEALGKSQDDDPEIKVDRRQKAG